MTESISPPMFGFELTFEDGSRFKLPEDWEEVFGDYSRHNPEFHPKIAERLRFLAVKYMEHQAMPNWLDCFGPGDDSQLDVDSSYHLNWHNFNSDDDYLKFTPWRETPFQMPPTQANIAEALLYYAMKDRLLQQRLGILDNQMVFSNRLSSLVFRLHEWD